MASNPDSAEKLIRAARKFSGTCFGLGIIGLLVGFGAMFRGFVSAIDRDSNAWGGCFLIGGCVFGVGWLLISFSGCPEHLARVIVRILNAVEQKGEE